jgi:hypothetical protein
MYALSLPVLEPPWQTVSPPSGWTWDLPFTIQRKGRLFRPHPAWSLRALAASGKAYYVSPSGSDSNDGLSWDRAYRSIWKASTQADAVVVYIQAGYYGYAHGFRGAANNASTFIGVGGQVIANNDLELSGWSANGSAYQVSTAHGVDCVLDWLNLDSNGYPTLYSEKTSLAEVQASPGSWWKDGAGNTLYVRCVDSRPPDANLRAYRNTAVMNVGADDRSLYFENITFEVSAKSSRHVRLYAATSAGGFRACFKNCVFRHCFSTYHMVQIHGVAEVIYQNCSAYHSLMDGFNYDVLNTIVPKAIEIRCRACHCGNAGGSTYNASTVHNGVNIVRLMGDYARCYGPSVADAGNCRSWNLGCVAHDSLSPSGSSSTSFYLSAPAGSLMWLDRCTSYHPPTYDLVIESGCTLRKRQLMAQNQVYNAGTLEDY